MRGHRESRMLLHTIDKKKTDRPDTHTYRYRAKRSGKRQLTIESPDRKSAVTVLE